MDYEQRYQHALTLHKSGRAEEALGHFAALAESASDPTDKASILIDEVDCLNTLGRLEEARQRLGEARHLLPRESEYHSNIEFAEVGILLSESSCQEALQKLEQLLEKNPELLQKPSHKTLYQEIQARRGFLLVELEHSREARPVLEEVLSYGIHTAQVCYYLGICYFDFGEVSQAKERLVEALKREQKLDDLQKGRAHYYLGMIYHREGAYARAKLEFELCAPLADQADIPRKYVFGWLEKTCRELNQEKEAERYEKLTKLK